jgi:hypothetical protein
MLTWLLRVTRMPLTGWMILILRWVAATIRNLYATMKKAPGNQALLGNGAGNGI